MFSGTKRTPSEGKGDESQQPGHTFVDLSQDRVFLLGDAEQPDPASHQPEAGSKRCHAPNHDVWTAWKMSSSRRAKEAIVQPDTVAIQLMIAGDIESNPGPIAPTSSGRRPDSRAKGRGRTVVRNHSGSQTDEQICRKCNKRVSRKEPLTCKECKHRFHDIHTGESRFACEKIRKFGRPWTCPYCRLGIPPTPDIQNTVTPGRCMAANCKRPKITSKSFLYCNKCKGQLHLQEPCSGMKRKQRETIDKSTWECDGCRGLLAGKPSQPETTTPVFQTQASKFVGKLRILQWNADSISTKQDELRVFLKDKEIDLFLIQETKMISKDKTPRFPGYTVLRKDRLQWKGKEDNRGGGLLIGIKENIPFREANIEIRGVEDNITESMTVEIPTKDKQKLRITNIYIPPIRSSEAESARQRKTDVKMDKWPDQPYDCIFGDVNAHSPLWDQAKPTADKRGDDIEEWIANSGMMTLNDGSNTRTNRSTNHDSTPDISLVHSSLTGKFDWQTMEDLGSDHKPIVITYEEMNAIPDVQGKPKYKWNFKKADWNAFTEEVEKNIPKNYSKKSTNKMEKILRKIITKAANIHVKKKKINNKTNPSLSPEITEAIKKRNQLRKSVASNRKEWREACNNVRDMVRENRKEKWKEYVESLDMSANPTQIWRTIHSLDGKYPAKCKNEVLTVNGVALIDDKDKANAFAKTYKEFSRLPTRKSDRKLRRNVRKRMKARPGVMEESEQDITMEELNRVINEAGRNKAAGEDDIPYELIKNLGVKARTMILYIFNKCWNGERIPGKWTTAIIRTLLKAGKDPKETSSYRPISLTSCLGKLLEKIISDRLTFILEKRKLLSDSQAGFRQNRCTTDQILKMTQLATDQIQQRCPESATAIAFFDYAKAYDKVWRAGLLHKMQEMSLPPKFIRYTRNFLSNRKTTVEIDGTRSKQFILKEGLPQGSAISPLLFIIFINDIGVDLHPDTIASLFADDTAIGRQGGNHEELKNLMQEEVNKILEWAVTWKMEINKDKTKAMVFSSSKEDREWDIELMADNTKIETVKQYRFLGVNEDNGLYFGDHVEKLAVDGKKRVRVIKAMAWKDWGNSLEVQRTLYLQWVRSALEYAGSSWTSWISDTKMKKLERVQKEALRAMAGLTKTCQEDFLNLETGVEPLAVRFKKIDEITYDKYARLPTEDSRSQLINKSIPPRLKTRAGWRHETVERVNKDIKRDITTPPTAPWRNMAQLNVQYVSLDGRKRDIAPEQLKQATHNTIETIEANLVIYTDGSTSGTQENGGAGISIQTTSGEIVEELSYPAGEWCSSFTGECVAFYEAIKWIRANEVPEQETVLICSDSMSLAQALDNGSWKDQDPWIKLIKDEIHELLPKIILLWIPSHCDVAGNERADELARKGTELDQNETFVTHKIVKAKIKSRKWTVKNEKAVEIYQSRRGPRFDIEKQWPKKVRSKFAQLRSGHAMELRYYRHKIGVDFSALCPSDCGVPEKITHVLCECASAEEARMRHWEGDVTPSMLTSHPDVARMILATKYGDLRLPAKNAATNDQQHSEMTEANKSGDEEHSARAPVAFA